MNPSEKPSFESENIRLKAQLVQLQENEAKAHARTQNAAHVSFCENLMSQGRLLPFQSAVMVAALDNLAAQAHPVEFGEGDDKAPLADALKSVLAGLPVQICFGEFATHGRASRDGALSDAVEYAEGVDPERIALDKRIRAHMKTEKTSYADAAQAVMRKL